MQRRNLLRHALVLAAFCATQAFAQSFPTKPIRLVVPFPAGGTSDVVGRLLANGISERLKQPVIVDNRAGAGTVIGTELVAKSAPDGYTLLLATPGLAINAARKSPPLPYDTDADLEAVATVVELPMAIFASSASGFKSMAEVIAAAKAKPGSVSYGTAGEGSTGQLGMKLVEQATGTKFSHIPFQGSAPSMNALLGGHVQLIVDTVFLGAPHVANNKIVGIATLGAARSKLLPNVPTSVESGVQVESAAWYSIFVRRGTPAPIAEQINAAIRSMLQDPKIRATLEKDGFQIVADDVPKSKARFKVEMAKMAAAVRDSQ